MKYKSPRRCDQMLTVSLVHMKALHGESACIDVCGV